MVKKIKKSPQGSVALPAPKSYATAYAARLAREVGQEFASPRQASVASKGKARSTGN
jgi:hypothetical protein